MHPKYVQFIIGVVIVGVAHYFKDNLSQWLGLGFEASTIDMSLSDPG